MAPARTAAALAALAEQRIPVEPFRRRFLALQRRDGLNATQLAASLGWYYGDGRPDSRRVTQTLGLRECCCGERGPDGKRKRQMRRSVAYGTAVKLADALGLDYVELGI
jgi:hypothetical protein